MRKLRIRGYRSTNLPPHKLGTSFSLTAIPHSPSRPWPPTRKPTRFLPYPAPHAHTPKRSASPRRGSQSLGPPQPLRRRRESSPRDSLVRLRTQKPKTHRAETELTRRQRRRWRARAPAPAHCLGELHSQRSLPASAQSPAEPTAVGPSSTFAPVDYISQKFQCFESAFPGNFLPPELGGPSPRSGQECKQDSEHYTCV
ncbi:PHD and RING finger domain-containing protein 1-like isoform X2 [Fukomys damarensis]|uniref:PHD and RING finger domain-containing protein 1-like isoform X2 n=1 Tax=Fukomys damarensis TaxID=885580 RepID=UPI0005402031|nr:PHD and RING finger domain-containing protein 1-like isoform X2 [Fukomys damarensis]